LMLLLVQLRICSLHLFDALCTDPPFFLFFFFFFR